MIITSVVVRIAKLSGIMSLRHDLSKEDYIYVSNLPSIETDDDFERYKVFCINHSSQKLRGTLIPSPCLSYPLSLYR